MEYKQVMYAAFQDELIKQAAGLPPALYNMLSTPQASVAGLLANGIRRVGGGVKRLGDLQYHPKVVQAAELARHGGGHTLPTLAVTGGHYGGNLLHEIGHQLGSHPLQRAGEVVHGLGHAVAHTLHAAHP